MKVLLLFAFLSAAAAAAAAAAAINHKPKLSVQVIHSDALRRCLDLYPGTHHLVSNPAELPSDMRSE